MAAMTEQTLYQVIGGETRLRELVDRFYDLMELEPEFEGIRAMHPPTTQGSRDKLFWFLSGWMGGPDLFVERFGHPRLRARHLPFAIGTAERDQLECKVARLDLRMCGEHLRDRRWSGQERHLVLGERAQPHVAHPGRVVRTHAAHLDAHRRGTNGNSATHGTDNRRPPISSAGAIAFERTPSQAR